MKLHLAFLAAAGLTLSTAAVRAQEIPIVGLAELSGTGATVGTNFDNAIKMAVKELNAAGGLLGRQVKYVSYDTQTNPGVAKALARRAVDENAVAVFGPVFSGSIIVSVTETRRAEIPNYVAGEAASFTLQGNPYVFRSSLSQTDSMPKVATYINDTLKSKSVAVVYANNDFGKGGRDLIQKSLKALGVTQTPDIVVEPGQVDMSSVLLKVKGANTDIMFAYLNEEESARLLREARKQGYDRPIVGETTIVNEKVIELAGDAASGVVAHVGLLADAPNKEIQDFVRRYKAAYNYTPDHNAMKGYIALNVWVSAVKKAGKIDPKLVAETMKNGKFTVADNPGILLDVQYDDKGDLARETFIIKVVNGKSEVIQTLKTSR